MKRIGLLSDTHGYFDEKLYRFFEETDEIWHAGDFGTVNVADEIAAFKPLRAVYGNCDGWEVRASYPEYQCFTEEEVKVLMLHIGGYPGGYTSMARQLIYTEKPKLYICGHSHILKVINDPQLQLLHINPGAAGEYGIHTVRTAVRFTLDQGAILDLEVGEWPRKY